MNKSGIFFSLIGFLIFFGIWEICSRVFLHLLFVLPPPSAIASTLVECHSQLLFHTWVTLKEMAGGFALALGVAFPLAWMMMRYSTSRAILQPFFIVLQCLPMFTLAPIMVVWFGWSYTAIVIPTALMIFFPLTLNIYQGLRSTPKELLEFFHTHQATEWQSFFKLRLPWAMPHIFAGFRISAAIAGIGAVAGEWAGGQNGLGMLMLESRRNTDLELTFSALVCLTLISACLYISVLICEKMTRLPREGFFLKKLQRTFVYFFSNKKRFILPIAAISLFFCCFIDCLEKKSTVRLVLDWLPNPNHVPLYVGIEKGFFKEEGICLSIQKMHENGDGIYYLASGQCDLLISHLPSALKASSQGAQIKIAGMLIKEPLNALIYRKDKDILTPSDLSGHVLGYCLGGPDSSFLDYLLQEGPIYPREKHNVSADLISAIGTASVDVIYGGFWNIEPAQLRSLGVETDFFTMQSFHVPLYYEMLVLSSLGTQYSKITFIEPFQRALQKSIDFCKAHPDQAFAAYLRQNPDKRKKNLSWEEEAWKTTYPLLTKDQLIDPECIENCYSWFLERKIINHPFDFHRLY